MVSTNMEFVICGKTAAMIRLRRERRLPAISFGTYPVRETTARTRSRVSGVTSSGWFRARDTVMGDTPATFATSRIVTALPIRTGAGQGVRSLGCLGRRAWRRSGHGRFAGVSREPAGSIAPRVCRAGKCDR